MDEPDIDRLIADGLLAYFRPGGRAVATQPPGVTFAESRRLLQLHWAFGPDTRALLEHLLRRHGEVVASSTSGVHETTGSIRGPGLWRETQLLRQVTADPSVVRYRDVRRTHDVGPNRVLQAVISNAVQVLGPYAGRTDLADTPYGRSIGQASRLAVRVRRVMELRGAAPRQAHEQSREPSTQDLRQASGSSKRLYILAARAHRIYRDIASNRLESLQESLSRTLVAPLFAWQRFELFTVLHLGLALHRVLGEQPHLRDLTGAMRGPAVTVGPFAVYWGVRPPGARRPSALPLRRQRIDSMLLRFGLSPRSGRSDITIASTRQSEVLAVVECKYSSHETDDSTRQFREAASQIADYVEDYGGDTHQRLATSAIVMRRLPREVSERDGIAGPGDLVALSAGDLLQESESLREWLRRLRGVELPT